MLLAAGLLLAADMSAKEPVKVSGDVYAATVGEHAVTIAVVGEQGDTLQLHETWTGRFQMRLPEERVLTLRFSGPGCLGKDVVIDTHYALDEDSRLRRVVFGVELEAAPPRPMRYAGAVGTIAFAPGTGRMDVQRHQAPVLQR